MQHATHAYQKTALETASLRDLESNLLFKSAAHFQAIRDNWDDRQEELGGALLFNRKLWTLLLTSVTRDDNPLASDVRKGVANLGLFVMNQTIKLMSNPQPDVLGALININVRLATGLQGKC
jgi:flagellar protein FlaF